MRINGHPAHDPHGAGLRHAGKARGGAGEVAAAASALAPAPAPTGPTAATAGTDTAAPPESTVEMAARKAPPGLLRVAARLEAMGAEARSGGQSNALTQITRNLQRYMDHQGLTPAAVLHLHLHQHRKRPSLPLRRTRARRRAPSKPPASA